MHWLTQRSELVEAKGKGKMQTFWVRPTRRSSGDGSSAEDSGYSETALEVEFDDTPLHLPGKLNRYVAWNFEVFEKLLRVVVTNRRKSMNTTFSGVQFMETPLQEVTEMIELPTFDAGRILPREVPELEENISTQLREFISVISRTYRPNPFHNFEHASHVLVRHLWAKSCSLVRHVSYLILPQMATQKLLLRVVDTQGKSASQAHDSTYGITSDPVIQLAVLFAALVHDCDHPGVPNAQFAKENPSLAARYANKSLAEQNSVDIAWDLLMMETFCDLQRAIFATESELRRFRQLVVNAVMATDIFDKDIKALREARWEKAFTETRADCDSIEQNNRKATIVLEYIIQAADVSHCMQHWKIYQKWNRCLFEEMYTAFVDGRSEKDPSIGWDKGELWFFDNYIIPLAQKLKECGVFGVSCDEFLDYARDNREEVANKGGALVEEWLRAIQARPRSTYHPERIFL